MPPIAKWIARLVLLAAASTSAAAADIEALLAAVPNGAAWQDLPPKLRKPFEAQAGRVLGRSRAAWDLKGLAGKERVLLHAPDALMRENIDRVLGAVYAPVLPGGFALARDVAHPELKRMLIRVYLKTTAERSNLLLSHAEFRAWDGRPVAEFYLLDHAHLEAVAAWMQDTEARLRKIPDAELTPTERALREQSYFVTRAYKHFTRPAVANAGALNFPLLYNLPPRLRPFNTDREVLDAYNASMFAQFREVDKGSLEAFVADYDSEFNAAWLSGHGMPPGLVRAVLKLGHLYRTRVLAQPDAAKRCTLYSAAERAALWDSFTAAMMTNADGGETLERYAAGFAAEAQRLVAEVRAWVPAVLDSLSPALTPAQRQAVMARLEAETRPAAMLEALYTALDEATGERTASGRLKAAVDSQQVGGYADGEALRAADAQALAAMWEQARRYIQREYGGYAVDIGTLVPVQPTLSATERESYANGGVVSIGLKRVWNQASLYSTLLHEIKHAIDYKTQAAVEGAAWEGAATSVERQVWPLFISEAMAREPDKLPLARLLTAIDNMRLAATTDAALKRYLRPSCAEDEPDSFEYAQQIIAGYGYTDPAALAARARRAQDGMQYLQYAYGLALYQDLLAYLQAGIGPAPRVDAYLLQACAMPNPQKNPASVERLLACVRGRNAAGLVK